MSLGHHHGNMDTSNTDDRDLQTPIFENDGSYPSFTFEALYNMTVNFFDTFMFPQNAKEALKINSTFFATDALGRVDATRDFEGNELNTEYAFGLFANLALNRDSFTLLGVPTRYTLIHMAANEYIVSVALVVDFHVSALGITNPVEIDFWCTFNHDGQIDQYDASFRYLQWQFDELLETGRKIMHLNTTAETQAAVHSKLAQSICKTAQTNCVGDNQQYDSMEECYHHLTTQTPFGQAHQMGMDTILCRMVHQNMVPFRPDVHCSHIGPSGGGYCTNDRTYIDTVSRPFFTKKPFVPYGFGQE